VIKRLSNIKNLILTTNSSMELPDLTEDHQLYKTKYVNKSSTNCLPNDICLKSKLRTCQLYNIYGF